MADKISVEIDLEGGKEVEQQLESIGKAGQQAFGDIQNAAEQVNLDSATTQFDDLGNAGQAAFQKIQTAAKSAVTFEQITQGVAKVQGSFEALGNAAEKVAVRMTKAMGVFGVVARALGPMGIAIGALGGAFVKFGNDAAGALDKLTVSGAKLGLTAQQFDALQQVLGRSGISGDALAGLEKFKETLAGDFFPRDVITGFQNFIAQLERMPDSVQRTQLAIARLGDELGGQVIAGLRTGAISAEQFAAGLGQVTPATQEQINQAARYQQALAQLSQAWNELKGTIAPITTPVFQFLTEQVNKFKEDLAALRLEIAFAKAIWDVFQAAISGKSVTEAADKAAKEYKNFETQLKATGVAGAQSGQQIAGGLNTVKQAEETVSQSWERRKAEQEAARQALDEEIAAEEEAAQRRQQALQRGAQGYQQLGQAARQAAEEGASGFNALNASMVVGIQVILQWQDALRRLAWYQNLPRPDSVLQGLRPDPIGAMAGGGIIGGTGTGTSDSNLAWVSRGEHIMPARAVSQPGVLSFLEALRRSGGNLSGVLDGLSRFALGGLVPRLPAYAAGGPVRGMNHVTIQFPGLPPVSGLRASAGVIDELRKSAALAQVRSGGRKPSRYS